MKLIIAGSRDITDPKILIKALAYAKISPQDVTEVVCGMAPGSDTLGKNWAEFNDIPVKQFPAEWNDLKSKPLYIKKGKYGEYNALAGFVRNQKMAEYADELLALWQNESPGTADMIDRMKKLNKPYAVYEV